MYILFKKYGLTTLYSVPRMEEEVATAPRQEQHTPWRHQFYRVVLRKHLQWSFQGRDWETGRKFQFRQSSHQHRMELPARGQRWPLEWLCRWVERRYKNIEIWLSFKFKSIALHVLPDQFHDTLRRHGLRHKMSRYFYDWGVVNGDRLVRFPVLCFTPHNREPP